MPLHIRSADAPPQRLTFTEHDTFLLGRMADCHVCLPDDTQVSRHHIFPESRPLRHEHHRPIRRHPGLHAPEQITNFKYVKPVSDVWSFAASLYSLLTGKFPYRFDPQRDPIDVILNENPVPIRERLPALEKNLAATIDNALARNPKARIPDAGKLLAAVQ